MVLGKVPRIFQKFCKRTRKLSFMELSPPQKSTRQQQHFIYHNSFSLTTTKSTPKPNNHGRLQRRRRSASSPGCLPGTYLASSFSVFDSASRQTTPLTDMSKLPSCHGEENRAPFWRTMYLSGVATRQLTGYPSNRWILMQMNIHRREEERTGCCIVHVNYICRFSIAHLQLFALFSSYHVFVRHPTHRRPITRSNTTTSLHYNPSYHDTKTKLTSYSKLPTSPTVLTPSSFCLR